MDGVLPATIGLPRTLDLPVPSLDDVRIALADFITKAADTTLEQVQAAARVTDTLPSEAQQEAGNYRKGKVALHGLQISIESPKGSVRAGKSKSGATWSVTMAHHYGYFNRSDGADGDPIDVFIGPDPDCELVFVIDQTDPDTSKFDEQKVMLGFLSEQAARDGYLACYTKGWKGLGQIKAMTLAEFKKWFLDGDHSRCIPKSSTGSPLLPIGASTAEART